MKVQALILVLLVPWFGHAQSQYYGTRVAGLELSGADSDADLQVIPLHTGDTITVDNVRSAIRALYATGLYNYVEVDATPAGNGATNLTFIVRVNFFFSTIRLD